jgi:hypothetical protein
MFRRQSLCTRLRQNIRTWLHLFLGDLDCSWKLQDVAIPRSGDSGTLNISPAVLISHVILASKSGEVIEIQHAGHAIVGNSGFQLVEDEVCM